jgi:hypothetical protein
MCVECGSYSRHYYLQYCNNSDCGFAIISVIPPVMIVTFFTAEAAKLNKKQVID